MVAIGLNGSYIHWKVPAKKRYNGILLHQKLFGVKVGKYFYDGLLDGFDVNGNRIKKVDYEQIARGVYKISPEVRQDVIRALNEAGVKFDWL